jgi:glutamate transport system substrate-binding protein
MALLLALALVAAACGDDDDDPAVGAGDGAIEHPAGSTMARLAEAGSITVGTKFDQPLFGLQDPRTEDVEGFDVEIARLIAERIGDVDVTFVETPSAIRETAIQDGTVDMVVATYTINDKRKEVIDFAGPYYVAGQDILVKKTNTTITGVDSLAGKKVCTVQGSTSLTNVQKSAPQADVSITFDKYSLCVEALKDSRVEAVTTDNVILLGFINDDPTNLKLVNKPFTTEPYGIGVKKGDTAFRTFINDTLEQAYKDGSWKKAWDDTAGKTGEAAPTPPPVNRYA